MDLPGLGIARLAAKTEDGVEERPFHEHEGAQCPVEGLVLHVVADPGEVGEGAERRLRVPIRAAAGNSQDKQTETGYQPGPQPSGSVPRMHSGTVL